MASITDVAKKAGVSVKTVSRILSGQDNVADKTKDKVKRVMAELEYYPSAAAQSLRGQQKGIVCLIAEGLTTTPDAFEIVAGIQAECEKHNKLLMIGESGGNPKNFERLVTDFRQQRAQAIIYATMYHREVHIEQAFNKCPLILVNCFEAKLRHPTIVPNDKLGAFEITNTLLNTGHQRIAYLTLFNDMQATLLRVTGYKEAHQQHNLKADQQLIIDGVCHHPADEFDQLPNIMENLFNMPSPPTAIMCGNDKMAMRVFMLVRRMGYSIPEDISIVGYDDYKMIATNLLPNLTTVSLPYYEMGKKAAELAINESVHEEVYQVSGSLIKRQSHSVK